MSAILARLDILLTHYPSQNVARACILGKCEVANVKSIKDLGAYCRGNAGHNYYFKVNTRSAIVTHALQLCAREKVLLASGLRDAHAMADYQ